MTSTPCRRDLLLIAAAGVAAAPALALTSTPTLAYQGNRERALPALGAAMQSLQAATPNKAAIASGRCASSNAPWQRFRQESISPPSTEAAATEEVWFKDGGRSMERRHRLFPARQRH